MPTERFSRVLVVEDNQAELQLLCDILQGEGFQVLGCGSATEALERIKERSFGVAIVDLRLPDLSGTQLLEKIRGYDEQVRVIIYTGAASYDSIKEALLDYSRAGRSPEPLEPVDVQSVLVQTVANLEASIRQQQATIEVGAMPTVLGDQTQLVQLFQNLIGNAVKFRRDVDPVVRVAAKPADDFWQFSVEDNGIGIAREHFGSLFQAFQQLHGRDYPGAGIGLAVCKKIVERHGGRIWLDSVVGQRTTFFFTLRRTKVD
jgi:light-regulated signal transduction histidine kinase (bacteriophytochrome)